MSRKKLLVVASQPYVPEYRVPLFQEIFTRLAATDIEFVVAAGEAIGAQAARQDQADASWRVDLPSTNLRVGNRLLKFRRLPRSLRPDLIVSELEALNFLGWRAAVGSMKLVLWGHGRPTVTEPSRVGDVLEWNLARRADAVMTYSPAGREYLISRGSVSPDKVVSIGNSTDTTSLRREALAARGRQELAIGSRPRGRALFVGGLDASKRIDFLLRAAAHARSVVANFELVVVGSGELEADVRSAGPEVVHIPSARGRELAELASEVDTIWMPGRVGLVAVDALALGLPILTTSHSFHAPEVEFMKDDELFYLPDDATIFAEKALSLGANRQWRLRDDIPSIESVAERFVDVVRDVLSR